MGTENGKGVKNNPILKKEKTNRRNNDVSNKRKRLGNVEHNTTCGFALWGEGRAFSQ